MATGDVRVGARSLVDRPDLAVLYLGVEDEPVSIAAGWIEVERRLGSLRGRRFLATIEEDRYRVSVVTRDDDDVSTLGLEPGVVAGGRYLRVRLKGDPDAIYARIASAMAELESGADRDVERPCIESYRRHDEVDLLVPVHGPARDDARERRSDRLPRTPCTPAVSPDATS